MCAYSDPTHRPDASIEDAIRESMALAMGLLLIVLGAVAIILPMVATLVVMWLLGWVLIFAAIAQFVEALLARGENGAISRVLLAVLYAVFGGVLLLRPVTAAIAATAIIATLFVVDGIMELGLASRQRGSTRGRGWVTLGGVLSIVIGVMIWRGFTLSAVWVIGLFVGVRVVFKGIEVMMRHRYPKNRFDDQAIGENAPRKGWAPPDSQIGHIRGSERSYGPTPCRSLKRAANSQPSSSNGTARLLRL